MTIYQNDIGTVFRIETGISSLSTATSILILVTSPSGSKTWTATQYVDPDDGATTQIEYTTLSGDLDAVGTYVLQPSISWGINIHLGDCVSILVEAAGTNRVNVSQLISKFAVYYRYIPVQTFIQSIEDPEEGTDSDILYDAFEMYSDQAADELDNIITAKGITLTNTQKYVALCHLVADYFEMGNPDFSFRSQSQAPGVSFSRGDKTGPRTALDKMLDTIEIATRRSMVTSGRGANMTFNRIKDAVNYPKRWKRTSIPAYDHTEDGFDSKAVSDMGYEENDNNNSAW